MKRSQNKAFHSSHQSEMLHSNRPVEKTQPRGSHVHSMTPARDHPVTLVLQQGV